MAMPKVLETLYLEAKEKKEDILKRIAPLREQEEEALQRLRKAEADLKKIRGKIVEIEKEGLADASRVVAALQPKAVRFSVGQ